MWFMQGNAAGLMTTTGKVLATYALAPGTSAKGIAEGPDGNAWITDSYNNAIERLTRAGQVTSYQVPSRSSLPWAIIAGSDGNLWFTEAQGDLAKISTSGVVTEFPELHPGGSVPALGPDGDIYVAIGDDLWRVTPSGKFTHYHNPHQKGFGQYVAVGPDKKALWLGISSGYIERFDLTTHAFSRDVQVVNGGLNGISAGPDHDVWYGGWNVVNRDSNGVIGVRD